MITSPVSSSVSDDSRISLYRASEFSGALLTTPTRYTKTRDAVPPREAGDSKACNEVGGLAFPTCSTSLRRRRQRRRTSFSRRQRVSSLMRLEGQGAFAVG